MIKQALERDPTNCRIDSKILKPYLRELDINPGIRANILAPFSGRKPPDIFCLQFPCVYHVQLGYL